MARFEITYACGHTGTVQLTGKHSFRDWKLAQLKTQDCLECYKEKRSQVAAQETTKRDLIPLIGTENQVKWALDIRIWLLNELETLETRFSQTEELSEEGKLTLQVIDMLYQVDSAHQWIEWRGWNIVDILRDLKKKVLAVPTSTQVAQQQQQTLERAQMEAIALAEATLRPEQPLTEVLAEITYSEDVVHVRFSEIREDFNSLMRNLGYTWDRDNRRWERKLLRRERTGPARERAIELGHVLLSHNFCVCVFDHDLRDAIIAGVFEPEQTRWVAKLTQSEYAGWFYIQWGPREDFYDVARRIKGSRYHKPFVAVPPASYEIVLDFAERYDFRLTRGAQEAVTQARELREATLVVKKAAPIPQPERTVASTKLPILKVPEQVEVAEEFLDSQHPHP